MLHKVESWVICCVYVSLVFLLQLFTGWIYFLVAITNAHPTLPNFVYNYEIIMKNLSPEKLNLFHFSKVTRISPQVLKGNYQILFLTKLNMWNNLYIQQQQQQGLGHIKCIRKPKLTSKSAWYLLDFASLLDLIIYC